MPDNVLDLQSARDPESRLWTHIRRLRQCRPIDGSRELLLKGCEPARSVFISYIELDGEPYTRIADGYDVDRVIHSPGMVGDDQCANMFKEMYPCGTA